VAGGSLSVNTAAGGGRADGPGARAAEDAALQRAALSLAS